MKLVEYLRGSSGNGEELVVVNTDRLGTVEIALEQKVMVCVWPMVVPMRQRNSKSVRLRELERENARDWCAFHGCSLFNDSHGWRGRRGKRGCSRRERMEAISMKRRGGKLWYVRLLADVAAKEAILSYCLQMDDE